jgi:uncharacterized membrane protein
VHFPIAAIALTGALDILHVAATNPLTSSHVVSIVKTLDFQIPLGLLPMLSYYSTIAALLATVPAVLSGGSQLLPLIQKHGFKSPKVKTAIAHAMLNDLVAFGMAYNWWTRRNVVGFAPSTVNLILSGVLGIPVVFFAAKLGGDLVYTYGMGMENGRADASAKGKKS